MAEEKTKQQQEPKKEVKLDYKLKQQKEEEFLESLVRINGKDIPGNKSYIEVLEKHNITEDVEVFIQKRRKVFVELLQEKFSSSMLIYKCESTSTISFLISFNP